MVFKVVKELSRSSEYHTPFGIRRPDDADAEAAAWKTHFEAIQAGLGQIPNAVSQDISRLDPATWLDTPPLEKRSKKLSKTWILDEHQGVTCSWRNIWN